MWCFDVMRAVQRRSDASSRPAPQHMSPGGLPVVLPITRTNDSWDCLELDKQEQQCEVSNKHDDGHVTHTEVDVTLCPFAYVCQLHSLVSSDLSERQSGIRKNIRWPHLFECLMNDEWISDRYSKPL